MPWLGAAALAVHTSVFRFESLAHLAFAYPSRRLESTLLANPPLHAVIAGSVLLQSGTVWRATMRGFLGLGHVEEATLGSVGAAPGMSWQVAEPALASHGAPSPVIGA